jgi:putative ABC transport system permease protein
MAGYRVVDNGYFEAMGIARLPGAERALDRGEALIDRRLMQVLLEGRPPDGTRVQNSFAREVLTVSGVVGTVREWHQGDGTIGAIYVHYRRHPLSSMHLVIRHDGRATASLADAARRALAGIDPLVPSAIEPFDVRVADALRGPRLLLVMALGFGAATLLLSAAGIYALVAFVAGRQLREAAIRLALGARPDMLQRRVLTQGVRPAVAGLALGLLLVPALTAAIRSQLFQTSAGDPLALGAAVIAILIAAVAASIAPARRSARIDPAVALRQE